MYIINVYNLYHVSNLQILQACNKVKQSNYLHAALLKYIDRI